MDKDRLNNMVVDLFHGISYEEEKAVITDEFKDISNKDLHIIDAIGIKKTEEYVNDCRRFKHYGWYTYNRYQ